MTWKTFEIEHPGKMKTKLRLRRLVMPVLGLSLLFVFSSATGHRFSQAAAVSNRPPLISADAKEILKEAVEACLKVKTAEYTYVREMLQGMQFAPITARMRQERADVPTVWMAGRFSASGKIELRGKTKEFAYAYDGKVFRYLDETDKVANVIRTPARDSVGPLLAQVGLGVYAFPEFSDSEPLKEFTEGPGEWSYGGTSDVEGTSCSVIIRTQNRTQDTPRGKVEMKMSTEIYIGQRDHLPRRYVVQTNRNKTQATARNLRINQRFDDMAFLIETPSGYVERPFTAKEINAVGLLEVGTSAPDWELKDATGRVHTLSEYRGKVLVLDFWATWCAPCLKTMPMLQALSEKFKGRNVQVLGINILDDGNLAASYMKQKGYTYDLLVGGDSVAEKYNARVLPTLYVVGLDGKIVHAERGYRADPSSDLKQIVESYLQSQSF